MGQPGSQQSGQRTLGVMCCQLRTKELQQNSSTEEETIESFCMEYVVNEIIGGKECYCLV